ncbi:hypothetical protein BDV12DRAFT_194031 [Aspergillus spectabilis]
MLLRLLQSKGHHFEFDGRADLEQLNRIKLSKFKPEALYSFKTTALHSLEAFISMIDFDKVAHQKDGLKILTTLLHNGYSPNDLGLDNTDMLSEVLCNALLEQGGTIGFAPSIQADADDTAKALLAVSLLDKPLSTRGLLDEFEGPTHFRTYHSERDPSFTANCTVLLALLSRSDASKLATQIQNPTAFLCDIWWIADGHTGDKWNLSPYYPSMLMAEAFGRLLQVWSEGALNSISNPLIRDRVSISLYQALLPVVNQLWTNIQSAVSRGRRFLQKNTGDTPEYLWVEKVTYGSMLLSESYVLAALKVSYERSYPPCLLDLFNISKKTVNEFARFNSMIPLFSSMELWKNRAAIVEGYMLLPQLRERRLTIFPRTGMEEDKYFEYVPFTWTLCNNRNNTFLSTKTLVEEMVISFLNYQADEFMEAVVGRLNNSQRSMTRSCIGQTFLNLNDNTRPDQSCLKYTDTGIHTNLRQAERAKSEPKQLPGEVATILHAFVHHVMNHPSVEAAAPPAGVYPLKLPNRPLKLLPMGAFHLLRPHVLPLLIRILPVPSGVRAGLNNQRRTFFHTCEEKYVAEGMCRHLAVMCRMYNDYGSLPRDREEKNLNSVNFPEFAHARPESDDIRRKQLFTLAEFERPNVEQGLKLLTEMAGQDKTKRRIMEKVQMFCDVTGLYGQIYTARDIASRT